METMDYSQNIEVWTHLIWGLLRRFQNSENPPYFEGGLLIEGVYSTTGGNPILVLKATVHHPSSLSLNFHEYTTKIDNMR